MPSRAFWLSGALFFQSAVPLLKELGLNDCGFHAFRRFRATYLRKQRTPEGVTQFWLGHAGKTITDGYDRVRDDVVYRKQVAAAVGTGFTVPSVVVQKSVESSENVVAVEEQEPVATL